jgi:hypothetical protein
VPDEYRCSATICEAQPSPIPAYQVSQWMHLGKAQVEEVCTSETAQRVIRYSVEVRDPSKPWIKTPMIELIPTPTPDETAIPEPESEPDMATAPKAPAPTEASVQFVITDSATTTINGTETPAPQPKTNERFYRVGSALRLKTACWLVTSATPRRRQSQVRRAARSLRSWRSK